MAKVVYLYSLLERLKERAFEAYPKEIAMYIYGKEDWSSHGELQLLITDIEIVKNYATTNSYLLPRIELAKLKTCIGMLHTHPYTPSMKKSGALNPQTITVTLHRIAYPSHQDKIFFANLLDKLNREYMLLGIFSCFKINTIKESSLRFYIITKNNTLMEAEQAIII
ncbi:hypothetical protein J4526_07485 [Desulfurococcaceae archaeon MEX13E-LK6-19]|nr:hypothetical protein J4526_07485 [Desulfurococcaceae archaeon MEX13E-LK6-19]